MSLFCLLKTVNVHISLMAHHDVSWPFSHLETVSGNICPSRGLSLELLPATPWGLPEPGPLSLFWEALTLHSGITCVLPGERKIIWLGFLTKMWWWPGVSWESSCRQDTDFYLDSRMYLRFVSRRRKSGGSYGFNEVHQETAHLFPEEVQVKCVELGEGCGQTAAGAGRSPVSLEMRRVKAGATRGTRVAHPSGDPCCSEGLAFSISFASLGVCALRILSIYILFTYVNLWIVLGCLEQRWRLDPNYLLNLRDGGDLLESLHGVGTEEPDGEGGGAQCANLCYFARVILSRRCVSAPS